MSQASKEFQLTGWHVLAMLVVFFGVIFTVNGMLVYYSQTSWTGLVPGNGYEASKKYNKQAATARAMLAKGWHTKVIVLRSRRVAVELKDAKGQPLTGMQVTAVFSRPVGTRDDRTMSLRERTAGHYETAETLPLGKWIADIRFHRNGELQWRATADFLMR